MENQRTIILNLFSIIKEHSRTLGVVGAIFGAILVIYYCASINHYPSGLTITDALFFIWAIVVFGFYYSVAVFGFFIASVFWVSLLAKPINYILKLSTYKGDIVLPLPKSDWFTVVAGGLFANGIIFSAAYINQHPMIVIIGTIVLVAFGYVLVSVVSSKSNQTEQILDSTGSPIVSNRVSKDVVIMCLCAFVYITPLVVGQIGGGVTRTTFEKMGVRQIGVDLLIDQAQYKNVLPWLKTKEGAADLNCIQGCWLKQVDVLFTNVGANTKLKLHNSSTYISIPTKAILMTVSTEN
ncbi:MULTISPECIES: hypothetical protein [Vibrio]|uniref:hypothetical protein n=1 Tax=Vibrio TaxID=662 RepID=UPI001F0B445E|nr:MULTISPECIES: hypothetical protein [Vibrio]